MAKTSMYAIDRSEEYLAHYGIKGMKWGVRKAIAYGGTGLGNRRLARQYQKAQKKLAKLEKRANNGAKYARRAAALGAGAAAAGGLAALGTTGLGNAIARGGMHVSNAGHALMNGPAKKLWDASLASKGAAAVAGTNAARGLYSAGKKMYNNGLGNAGGAVRKWGFSNSITNGAADAVSNVQNKIAGRARVAGAGDPISTFGNKSRNISGIKAANQANIMNNRAAANKLTGGVTNGQIARAGAAALGLGLAGAAGYNAYRAATTKRAAKKAAEFRKEMNKTFTGTAYGQKSSSNAGGAKKRRRR